MVKVLIIFLGICFFCEIQASASSGDMSGETDEDVTDFFGSQNKKSQMDTDSESPNQGHQQNNQNHENHEKFKKHHIFFEQMQILEILISLSEKAFLASSDNKRHELNSRAKKIFKTYTKEFKNPHFTLHDIESGGKAKKALSYYSGLKAIAHARAKKIFIDELKEKHKKSSE